MYTKRQNQYAKEDIDPTCKEHKIQEIRLLVVLEKRRRGKGRRKRRKGAMRNRKRKREKRTRREKEGRRTRKKKD